MEDFRRFGASKDDSSLRAIVQGLAEDQKHAVAFKQGEMAQFGVAVAEILEVDGDQVYARIGPNTGWYDKEEITKLGLEWKSADDFNKREVTNNNVVVEGKTPADKKAQVQAEPGAFIVRRRTSPHSAVGLYLAWPVDGGYRYHANTSRPAQRVSYLPADEFWREFEKFDRRQVERVADVSPFLFRSRYLKQDAPPPVPKTDVEKMESKEEMGEPCQCPACGGQTKYMGKLGNTEWCRCEDCGMDVSKGGRTAAKKRTAESADEIVRQLEAGTIARPAAIRKLSGLAISQPEAVQAAFTKIRITPEEVERLQQEAHAFQSPAEEEGGVAVAPTPRSAPPISPESAENIPEEGKAEAIPEKFMDKFDVQKQIDGLLDRYNSGEISLEKLRYRMKDLVIRKDCRQAVRLALMNRFAPRSNILNEGTWEKAKAAADKSYNKSDDFYWAAVTDIYKKMGGKMKGKKAWSENPPMPKVPASPAKAPDSSLSGLVPDLDAKLVYVLMAIKHMTSEPKVRELIDRSMSQAFGTAMSSGGDRGTPSDPAVIASLRDAQSLMTPEATMYYALKTIKLMVDDKNIHEIIDLAISKWDDEEKKMKESSDLPPPELISSPDIALGEGEDQLRPVD